MWFRNVNQREWMGEEVWVGECRWMKGENGWERVKDVGYGVRRVKGKMGGKKEGKVGGEKGKQRDSGREGVVGERQ